MVAPKSPRLSPAERELDCLHWWGTADFPGGSRNILFVEILDISNKATINEKFVLVNKQEIKQTNNVQI